MRNTFKGILKKLLLSIDTCIVFRLDNRQKTGVLLVRLDAIGDFIIWLDSAKEYRRIYPNQKITLVGNSSWSQMARALPYWDEVWPINIRDFSYKPFYRWAMLLKLRRANFETAIEPTFSRTMLGDSCIRASGAKHRIGSISNTCNIREHEKNYSDQWYTQLLPANSIPMMELDRNAEFISHLAKNKFISGISIWPMAAELLPPLKIKKAYAIIFPGASWQGRKWPHQNFYKVGEQLNQKYSWQILLCGADSDYVICQQITMLLPSVFVNLAGKTTLQELAELIRGAQVLISNETSAVHIAAAVGTFSVCILGGGHFGRFVPYPDHVKGAKPIVAYNHMFCFNCNWKCEQPHDSAGPVPCITGVSVEQVLSLIPNTLISVPNSI
jgi:ADP-heptose:LPS heptosyltransferase